MNQNPITLRDVYEPLIATRSRNNIRIKRVVLHGEQDLAKTSRLYKNLFRKSFTEPGEKELANGFRQALIGWRDALKQFKTKSEMVKAPGKDTIENGQVLLSNILEHTDSYGFIKSILGNSNDLQDFEEDYDDLDDFYNNQFNTWQKLAHALNIKYKDNRTALDKDPTAQSALVTLQSIYDDHAPYGKLRQVEGLINQIEQVNTKLLEAEQHKAQAQVDTIITGLMVQLKTLPDTEKNQALYPLQQCKKRIDNAGSIYQIISEAKQAVDLEDQAIDIINQYIDGQIKLIAQKAMEAAQQAEREKSKLDNDDKNRINDKDKPEKKTSVPPTPPRKIVIISPSELLTKGVGVQYIETKEDIENYLDTLRQQLMKAVDNNEKIRIK